MIITILAFVFVAICLLTNKIPGAVACCVAALVLWISGVIDMNQTFANFISSSIVCMIGMQIITGALVKTDLLIHIAGLVKKFNGGLYIMLIAALIVPFILGQFTGGVTAMITVIPLVMALAQQADIPPTMVVLPASVGAQAGLMALPIGGSAVMYLMKNQIIESVGGNTLLGFWDLCLARLPGTLAVFAFVLFFGWKLLPKRGLGNEEMLVGGGMDKLKKSDLPKWKQNAIYVIFLVVLVLLSTARNIGLDQTMISTAGAALIVMLGLVKEREAFQSVNWSLIFMMGFMLAITTALSNSGAGEVLANLLAPVYGTGSTFIAVAATFIFCALLTQVMDNMSLINVMTPICCIAAIQNGISCVPIVLAIDASCLVSFTTPLASPSSLLAYQLGGYSMKEMLKFNVPILLISSVISILWIPFYVGLVH